MKLTHACRDCLFRQAERAMEIMTLTPEMRAEFDAWLQHYAETTAHDGQDPAVYSMPLYHKLSEISGVEDIFVEVRRKQNALALAVIDHVERAVRAHADPLLAAAHVAGAGNLIDSGVGVPEDVEQMLIAASDRTFSRDDSAAFFERLEEIGSGELLYVLDNAGEIVLDRLFMTLIRERFPRLRLTACVKGRPILNDALAVDAAEAGVTEVADALVTTGTAVIGAPWEEIDAACRETFERADVFLGKGQGNFETLDERPGGFLLLTAKCPVVAREAGVEVGEMAFVRSGRGV